MRLFEFANAEAQMELWKLITDSVWQAIYKQAQEQKQLDAQKAKSVSAAPKQSKTFKSKIVSPQASKAKNTSAQDLTLLNPSLRRLQCQVVVLLLQLEKISQNEFFIIPTQLPIFSANLIH
jgi:hypothetical protein